MAFPSPGIEQRRKEEDCHGRVLLLMDALGTHQMNAFIENDVLSFVPHSQGQHQSLSNSQSNKIIVITASRLSRVEASTHNDKVHLSVHPEEVRRIPSVAGHRAIPEAAPFGAGGRRQFQLPGRGLKL
jgi:hypothetical protein